MSYQVRVPYLPKASFIIFSLSLCPCLSTIFMPVHCLHTAWFSSSHRTWTHASYCSVHFYSLLAAEEKANTRLLLGMSLDSYARYLLDINQLSVAQKMYEKALQISNDVQGETHPQVMCTVGVVRKERHNGCYDLPGEGSSLKSSLAGIEYRQYCFPARNTEHVSC